MKNFVQPGKVLNVVAPRTVTSGEGVLVNNLFGVAAKAAASGSDLSVLVEGVVNLPKVSANTVAIGTTLFWDNTAFNVTTTAGSNKSIGYGMSVAGAGVLTCWVKLTPNLTATGAS